MLTKVTLLFECACACMVMHTALFVIGSISRVELAATVSGRWSNCVNWFSLSLPLFIACREKGAEEARPGSDAIALSSPTPRDESRDDEGGSEESETAISLHRYYYYYTQVVRNCHSSYFSSVDGRKESVPKIDTAGSFCVITVFVGWTGLVGSVICFERDPALLTTMADLWRHRRRWQEISRLRHLQSSYAGTGEGRGGSRFLQGSDRKSTLHNVNFVGREKGRSSRVYCSRRRRRRRKTTRCRTEKGQIE